MRIKLDEGSGESSEATVQMAPLIDCVFLLLIFFLVTAALKRIHKELPINLPDAGAQVKGKATIDMLIISVDRDGNIYTHGVKKTVNDLHRELRKHAAPTYRDGKLVHKRVRIDGDKEASFYHIVRIMDTCQFEGLKDIGVRVKPSGGT